MSKFSEEFIRTHRTSGKIRREKKIFIKNNKKEAMRIRKILRRLEK